MKYTFLHVSITWFNKLFEEYQGTSKTWINTCMRLLNFLKKTPKKDKNKEALLEVWRDCQDYFKLIGCKTEEAFLSHDFFGLYRGFEASIKTAKKFQVFERLPLGTHYAYFEGLNKWLKSNGYVPRDKAVFAISNPNTPEMFGPVYEFFPIGKFKWTAVKSWDFNDPRGHVSQNAWDSYGFMWALRDSFKDIPYAFQFWNESPYKTSKEVLEHAKPNDLILIDTLSTANFLECSLDTVKNWNKRATKAVKSFVNTNFKQVLQKDWEVWFDCKYYWLVDPNMWDIKWGE